MFEAPIVMPHPYRTGNYTPVQTEVALSACHFEGTIPTELLGGQYVRNGSNPASPFASTSALLVEDFEKPYHWVGPTERSAESDSMLTLSAV